MLINCTPHEVYDIATRTLLPYDETNEIRISCKTAIDRIVDGITVFRTDITLPNLPKQQDNVTYVVSALALSAIPSNRTDFVCPGNPVRNKNGEVYGCKGFRCK